jgi:hypothetical protein
MSFGVVITKSVAIVGVLLVFSYLVVPAVIAQMWANTVRGRLLFGWFIAILASTLGILWSFHSDYPTGPAIVVMLGLFLILSSVIYYIWHAPSRMRAAINAAGMALFCLVFLSSLAYFRKSSPAGVTGKISPVELFLNELDEPEQAHQIDGVRHLGDMRDPRIIPALTSLLAKTKSDEVVEATVSALSKQADPRAIPALQAAAKGIYDDFLKLTIGKAQLELGDTEGFATLITVLKDDEAGFARQQASELMENKAGRKFGYNAELAVAQNLGALKKIEEWYATEGRKMQLRSAK